MQLGGSESLGWYHPAKKKSIPGLIPSQNPSTFYYPCCRTQIPNDNIFGFASLFTPWAWGPAPTCQSGFKGERDPCWTIIDLFQVPLIMGHTLLGFRKQTIVWMGQSYVVSGLMIFCYFWAIWMGLNPVTRQSQWKGQRTRCVSLLMERTHRFQPAGTTRPSLRHPGTADHIALFNRWNPVARRSKLDGESRRTITRW